MTKCTTALLEFPSLSRHKVEAHLKEGEVISDGGVLLLREIDRRLGLTNALSDVIPDPRRPELITHSQRSLLKQRI